MTTIFNLTQTQLSIGFKNLYIFVKLSSLILKQSKGMI